MKHRWKTEMMPQWRPDGLENTSRKENQMAKPQDAEGFQPDGTLSFTVRLYAPLAKLFVEAMEKDERESKSEFARLLIKRQLSEVWERKAFEEFKRLQKEKPSALADPSVPYFPGEPTPEDKKEAV